MYADHITGGMRAAMDETARRRSIQNDYNEKNGIVPKTILKPVHELLEISGEVKGKDGVRMTQKEVEAAIAKLEKQMREAARMMEYEYAALLRDQIIELRGKQSAKKK